MKPYYIAVLIFLLALAGCSDDKILTNDIGSELEDAGAYRISTFTVSNEVMGADAALESVTVILIPEEGPALEFPAVTEVSASLMKCRMQIPKNESIPDGAYNLHFRMDDGTKLGGNLSVIFKNEMLHSTGDVTIEYTKLSGDGTMENPYLIKSKTDFTSLINNLRRDSIAHGSGRYFRQTATFDAPTQSELYDGRGYYNYGFAGSYDGGGYAIENIYYIGNKDENKDSGVGLFSELFDGAEIKNLNINSVNIQRTAGDCGALAGKASGYVSISNVKVKGNITEGGYRCGGLIGSLRGNLKVDNYDLSVTISGNNEVGGVLGQAFGQSAVNIHGVTTNDHYFSISGVDNVGGLIGRIDGEFHVARVELEHTVSSEDKDLKIISATGINQGGVIGYAENVRVASSLDSILVKCPVGGSANYVGGLVGQMKGGGEISVNYCRMTSVVTGGNCVGGLFGEVILNEGNKIVFAGNDNLTRVVADDTAAEISGNDDVGGLFGHHSGGLEFKSNATVAINLKSAGVNLGGAFGRVDQCTIDLSKLIMSSDNMKVEGSKECTGGLIGYAESCTINGPSSNNFDYTTSGVTTVPQPSRFTPQFVGKVMGVSFVGGIVGKMKDCSMSNIHAKCTVYGSGDCIGGIVGFAEFWNGNSNSMYDCTFDGTVNGESDSTGGVAGKVANSGTLWDCVNFSAVSGRDCTGGLVGSVDYFSSAPYINWCVNTGNVSASGWKTGGLIGYLCGYDYEMKVEHCANYGYVTTSGNNADNTALGGIIGFCPGTRIRVWHCANHGNIYAPNRQHGVGGIAGSLGHDPGGTEQESNLEIAWCCNRGQVESSCYDNNLGGILGYQEEGTGSGSNNHDSYLHDCINFGYIKGDQHDNNGGILGKIDHFGFVKNCVNFGTVQDGNALVGTHKSSCIWYHENLYYLEKSGKDWCSDGTVNDSNKGDKNKYKGFDFGGTWDIVNGYPALRDCPFQSVSFARQVSQ